MENGGHRKTHYSRDMCCCWALVQECLANEGFNRRLTSNNDPPSASPYIQNCLQRDETLSDAQIISCKFVLTYLVIDETSFSSPSWRSTLGFMPFISANWSSAMIDDTKASSSKAMGWLASWMTQTWDYSRRNTCSRRVAASLTWLTPLLSTLDLVACIFTLAR